MKKGILLIGLLLWSASWVTAQKKIEVQPHKPYSVEVRLSDYHKTEGDFLLNLPLTFSIINKNILIVMVGNDASLDYDRSVWGFSTEMDLAELMKTNRNVSAEKSFKKQNTVLNAVLLPCKKMKLYRAFDNGYESVTKNAKPFFFEILNLSPNEPLKFSLQFYVTKSNASFPYFFIAKCKPIEFELTIK